MVKKDKTLHYYEGIGRRKEAVARVRLYIVGKDKTVTVDSIKMKQGDIYLNKKPIAISFPSLAEKITYLQPLKMVKSDDRFIVSVHIKGGGKAGQLEAVVHGLARALVQVDDVTYRPLLREEHMLTRDPRTRERRKVGTGGKARRAKQSPKR